MTSSHVHLLLSKTSPEVFKNILVPERLTATPEVLTGADASPPEPSEPGFTGGRTQGHPARNARPTVSGLTVFSRTLVNPFWG